LIVIDLLYNLSILVSLIIISAFLNSRIHFSTVPGKILQGLLFGAVAVIGMMQPFTLQEGLIFDGRSIILSIGALFYGPLSGVIAALMAGIYRTILGGPGALMGSLVILSSFLIGGVAHGLYRRGQFSLSNLHIYIFGVIVSAMMIFFMLFLPQKLIFETIRTITATVMIFYPLITLLVSKIFITQLENDRYIKTIKSERNKYRTTLLSIGDAVMITDAEGRLSDLNKAAAELIQKKRGEVLGRGLSEVLILEDGDSGQVIDDPAAEVIRTGQRYVLPSNSVLRTGSGELIPVADSAAPILDENENLNGVVIVLRNNTAEWIFQRQMDIRLRISEFALTHDLQETLVKTLDEVCALLESPIGFYHFVDEDENQIHLQAWSSRTTKEFCGAEGSNMHYPVEKAGVWADCIRERKAVVHNDYRSHPHRKGLPEGHAEVIRELVVPIMRNSRVVAILGVGNKASDYNQRDVDIVSFLADVAWETAQNQLNREALEESTKRLEKISANLQNGMIYQLDTGRDGSERTFSYISQSVLTLHGVSADAVMKDAGLLYRQILEEDRQELAELERQCMESMTVLHHEFRSKLPDGSLRWFMVNSSPRRGSDGRVLWDGYEVDITEMKTAQEEREKLQEQLNQAQKMEGIGQLAGGIAHDFNNILQAILTVSDILLEDERLSEKQSRYIREINKGAERAAVLTRQLLAFARKQIISPRTTDLNELVESMLNMLHRLIGEEIDLIWEPSAEIYSIFIDPGQMDQVLVNLCVNARDAMDGKGRIRITTENVSLSEVETEENSEQTPGKYVRIRVADTGCGMDRNTLNKIFEPFFTTKGLGKGTGLGLSTVFGIVKQNRGYIRVDSKTGRGTEFIIDFPISDIAEERESGEVQADAAAGRQEQILICEDDPALSGVLRNLLEDLGYRILTAENPEQALTLFKENADSIELLLTDVIMPRIDGKALSEALLKLKPGLKILFMSGYTGDILFKKGIRDSDINFIEKPFTRSVIAKKLRDIIEH